MLLIKCEITKTFKTTTTNNKKNPSAIQKPLFLLRGTFFFFLSLSVHRVSLRGGGQKAVQASQTDVGLCGPDSRGMRVLESF